jgi:hypothetical protein
MWDAHRVAGALAQFEALSGLTSAEFAERYERGEFRGTTWALAWHSLAALGAVCAPARGLREAEALET